MADGLRTLHVVTRDETIRASARAASAALEEAGLTFLSAETAYVPQNTIAVESQEDAKKILRLIDDLEENDDVQNVYANYDMPEEWLAEGA